MKETELSKTHILNWRQLPQSGRDLMVDQWEDEHGVSTVRKSATYVIDRILKKKLCLAYE